MGASLSWASVSGVSRAELLRRAGLVETGRVVPGDRKLPDGAIGLAELPGGRLLLISDDCHEINADAVADLVESGEAVGAMLEEHVMVCEAWGVKDGEQIWWIRRDPDEDELQAEGDLPPRFGELLTEAEKARAAASGGVDLLFNVPLGLAAEIGRFSHERDLDGPPPEIMLLEPEDQADEPAAARPRPKPAQASSGAGLFGALKGLFGRGRN